MAQRRLRDPEGGIDVGFKRRVKIFGSQLFKGFTELLTTGVIDQNIQPAQLRDGFFDQILAEGFVPNVPRQRDGIPAFGFDQVDDLRGVFFLFRQVVNGHVCAFAGIGDGHCATDTRVTAGDQRFFTGQAAMPFVASFPVVGYRLHFGCQSRWRLWLFRERGLRVSVRTLLGITHS